MCIYRTVTTLVFYYSILLICSLVNYYVFSYILGLSILLIKISINLKLLGDWKCQICFFFPFWKPIMYNIRSYTHFLAICCVEWADTDICMYFYSIEKCHAHRNSWSSKYMHFWASDFFLTCMECKTGTVIL